MSTKPVVSAAKFTAYRKSHEYYCSLLIAREVALKNHAEQSDIDRLSDMISAAEDDDRKLAKPIVDAIRSADGDSRVRTMSPASIARQSVYLEDRLRIPKNAMYGMRVRIITDCGLRIARKTWKYPAMATAAYLTNRRGSWQIDEIRRIDTRGIARAITVLHIPDAARDKIVEYKLSSL